MLLQDQSQQFLVYRPAIPRYFEASNLFIILQLDLFIESFIDKMKKTYLCITPLTWQYSSPLQSWNAYDYWFAIKKKYEKIYVSFWWKYIEP